MTSKHTPGPWASEIAIGTNNTDCGVEIHASGTYRGNVAWCHSAEHIGGITMAERNANAALVAAAPELLKELENMTQVAWDEGIGASDIIRARAAIAKARGEA